MTREGDQRKTRWWLLGVIGGLWLAAMVWVRLTGDRTGQEVVTLSLAAGFVGLLLVVIWLLALSALPWRRRLLGLSALIAVAVAASMTLRVRGVSGDLVPLIGWRWSTTAAGPTGRSAVELAGPLADYPQFLGPERNARVADLGLSRDWEASPPRELWRRPIGEGWSAFAVVGERAITQEQLGDRELVTAYDLTSGKRLWEHADTTRYETTVAGVGPRATPTVVDGRVFTQGAQGLLNALDLETGRRLWVHDLEAEYHSPTPEWGRAGSPLVTDGLVVINAGGRGDGSLMAFDAATGELRWQAGEDGISYASPMLATLAGVRQIVIFNRGSIAGHKIEGGRQLWQFPWSYSQPNVAQPVVISADRLLVSSGYGQGSKLLTFEPSDDGLVPRELWRSSRLKAKFTNVVVHGGFVYGLDDGVMVCLDPESGERRWKRGRYGHGQVILADDLLVVQTEGGDVVLLEPDPLEHRELGRIEALDGKTWNSPALAGRYLLLRNHREAVLFELPLAG